MSINQNGQNRQNVPISDRERKALARIGVTPDDLGLPAQGLVLGERQMAFVMAYVENGGDRTKAADQAGYSNPKQSAADLMRSPAIRTAIQREQALAVAGMVALADKTLSVILGDEDQPAKVRIAAARVAYERGGVLKRAALDAAKPNGDAGDLADMTPEELQRVIAEAAQRIADREGAARTLEPGPDGIYQPVQNGQHTH